ncbi:MAG TPA: hypothetical protein PK174_02660 [Anaerolineaceae bacterium]|nr:hypothetical protein [Anaerolineaceae bacterium]
MKKLFRNQDLWTFLLLTLACVIAYVPLIAKQGPVNDDWYLIYGAYSQGAEKFHAIFASDRPLRAYHMQLMWSLFGAKVIMYHICAIILRIASGMGLYWIIRLVWKNAPKAAALAALLLVLYPGFLDMPNAIDYQSHILAFTLAVFSILFTVIAIQLHQVWGKVVFIVFSLILQLIYLGLMEYYIGLEGLRLFLVGVLILRSRGVTIRQKVGKVIAWAIPGGITAAGFLYWRAFIFQSTRSATNLGNIFTRLKESLQLEGAWLVIYQIQDFLNVVFFAWAVPFSNYVLRLRLKEFLPALVLGLAAGFVVWAAFHYKVLDEEPREKMEGEEYRRSDIEMLVVGVLAVIFALIPAHVGDRHVVFSSYSRFSFPPSIGAVLFLVALGRMFIKPRLRVWSTVLLVLLAVMTHYGNSTRFAANWDVMRSFWWQVSWRAPQIKPGTTIVATYANQGVPEDYHIWGPANLIYYPTRSTPPWELTNIEVKGSTLTLGDIQNILTGAEFRTEGRSFVTMFEFSKILVMAQPSSSSCVHVIDGLMPDLSEYDRSEILLVSSKSNLENILTTEKFTGPPVEIFGQEPEHTWCYYYQKASYARQQKDWKQIAELETQAEEKGLRPGDPVELLPFLESNAMLGNESKVESLSTVLKGTRLTRLNACNCYRQDLRNLRLENPDGYKMLIEKLCD